MGIDCVLQLRDGRLLSGGADKTICVWETDTGECTHSIGVHPLGPVGEEPRGQLLRDELHYPLIDERLEKALPLKVSNGESGRRSQPADVDTKAKEA